MSRKLRPDPPTGTLVISALVLLNAIVLKEGLVSDYKLYWWLFITVPLLLITIIGNKPRGHAIPETGTLTKKSHHLN